MARATERVPKGGRPSAASDGGMSVREVPVRVSNSERSTVQVVPATARLLADLFEIRRRARQGRYQVHEAGSAAPGN